MTMIVETMHTPADFTPPLEVVEFDYDMDRMQEWWVLDSKGKKVARFFDRYSAKEFLTSYDSSYRNSKIQKTQN